MKKKSHQRNRRYKVEQNGNFRTKNTIIEILNSMDELNRRMKKPKKKSVNLKIENKLPNISSRVKIGRENKEQRKIG